MQESQRIDAGTVIAPVLDVEVGGGAHDLL